MAEQKLQPLKPAAVPAASSWGGIGGSGKHAAELMAELASVAAQPNMKELMQSQLAWGGIGGSGKHAADLQPEIDVTKPAP